MAKPRLLPVALAFFLLLPGLVLADCVDLGSSSDWYIEDSHTITFFRAGRPVARLTIPSCEMKPSSRILLTKSYVCDGDRIIVDNAECRIMTLDAID